MDRVSKRVWGRLTGRWARLGRAVGHRLSFKQSGRRAAVAWLLAAIILSSVVIPVAEHLIKNGRYQLASNAAPLLGRTNANLHAKLSYDVKKEAWIFNQAGLTKAQASGPAAELSKQVGGNGKNDTSLYSATLPAKAEQGITYSDNQLKLAFSMTPQFGAMDGKDVDGRLVYPLNDGGRQLVYTLKGNGLKEDIILPKANGDELNYSYKLNLPKELSARLNDDGTVGIYSADPALFGDISYGGDSDQAKVESARANAPRNNMVFAIPAPVIKDSSSSRAGNAAAAYFELNGTNLTVHAKSLAKLSYPVSIDPSVVITSSTDFSAGNVADNIDYTGGQIARDSLGGQTIGAWSSKTYNPFFTTARQGQKFAVYNGILYMISGYSATYLTDVQYTTLGANGTIGAWTTASTTLNTGRRFFNASVYNGYLYAIGGQTAASTWTNTVEYAKINANGSVGTWATTSPIGFIGQESRSDAYNGYLYVTGGNDGATTYTNAVQYAPINADGTLGTWVTTSAMASPRAEHGTITANGYIYAIGGYTTAGARLATVEYAKLNSDGSVSTWLTTTSTLTSRASMGVTYYKGSIYLLGGNAQITTVDVGTLNANGTIASWQTTTPLNVGRRYDGAIAYGGYLYVIGGIHAVSDNACIADADAATVYCRDTLSAKLDPAGTPATFTNDTTHTISTARALSCTVAANGFLYNIGGSTTDSGSSNVTNVDISTLAANGTLGAWTAATALPIGRGTAGCAAAGGYIYVVGGLSGANNADGLTYYATLNSSTGAIGTWNAGTSVTTLTASDTPVGNGVFIRSGFIYSLGGRTTQNNTYYAPLNATTGAIGAWTSSANLMVTSHGYRGYAMVGKYLYAFGGSDLGTTVYNDVEYAAINADGSVGVWTATAALPGVIGFLHGAESNGCIYTIGGETGAGASVANVYYACPNANGTITSWNTAPSLTAATTDMGGVAYKGFLYGVGGFTTAVVNSTQYAALNNGGSGTSGTWTTNGTSLVTPYASGWAYGQTFASNGYLFTVGGYTGTGPVVYNNVYSAPINANGSVGSWTATTSMNTARHSFGLQVYGGYVYVVAGRTTAGGYLASVESAQIFSNGTLGAWTSSGNSLASSKESLSTAIIDGYLYALGGFNGAIYSNDVQIATLGAAGAVGAWTTSGNTFTTARRSQKSVVNNGYLYIIGGQDSAGNYLSDVQSSLITGATIGAFANVSNLDIGRANFSLAAANGFLYIYGGTTLAGGRTDVQYAAFLPNGGLDAWQYGTSFSTSRNSSAHTFYNGYLYSLGGFASAGPTYYTDVQYAPVTSQPRLANYSKLIDLGGLSTITSLAYGGSLPGGINSLSAKTAGISGVFGSSQTGGAVTSGITKCAAGGARFILLTANIDDSNTSIFPDGAGSASNLTDLTINYIGEHATPAQRLYGGKYFTSEALQPLDTCQPA